jgi:peptidyl-tRNA hydrolase, PTH1 family
LADLVVFHDEIELPPSKVRVKIGGSDAGHNGLRSISSHAGNDYKRVRLGVGHPRDWLGPRHPNLKDVVYRHVLSDFAKSDHPWVEALLEAIAENAGLLATNRDSTFANRVHLALQAKGFFDKDDDGAA